VTYDLLHELLHRYGYAFVGGLLLLESTGLPLPGETVMIAAALYAAQTHNLALVPLLAAAFAGAVLGGSIGYGLGRRFGPPLLVRFGPRIGLNADRRLLGRYLMQRNGAALVFLGRFFAVLRSVAALLAGASGMGWQSFMLFNVLGGAAWTGVYCLGGYWFGRAIMNVAGQAGFVLGIAALAAVIVAAWIIRRHEARLLRAARRAEAAGEIC
jgi:membrane protein DedA with SNARE-associated domain